MKNLEQQILDIKLALDRVAQQSGKRKVNEIRWIYGWSVTASDAMKLLLDPAIVFHIDAKFFEFLMPENKVEEPIFEDFLALCDWLAGKKALTDADIARVQWTLQTIHASDLRKYAQDFLCKKIPLGVTAKTVNKVLGKEFIPEFRCMLANKYFEHADEVEGEFFYLTEKFNGIRCVSVVKEDGVKLFSGQGQPIEGLLCVEADLDYICQRVGKPFVIDGELLVTNRDKLPPKEQYKKTANIVRRDGVKAGVTYHVFDVIDIDAWEGRCCETAYYLRRQRLETYCAMLPTDICVRVAPVLYHGNDTSKILEHLQVQQCLNHDGVMINLADEPYQFSCTNALLEVTP